MFHLRLSMFLNIAPTRPDLNMGFKNKVVLITGASSGIGAATAILFAKEGANVVIVGRNEDRLNKVAKECEKAGNKLLTVKADVSNDEDAKDIVKQAINKFGKLDVLVNNAGILKYARILDENVLPTYDEVVNTNLRAALHITSLAAPHLIKTKGHIINVSSIAAVTVLSAGFMPYSVTKAGMDHFSRGVARELAPYGVRVNAVNPGPVKTAIFNAAGVPEAINGLTEKTALRKASEPEEVAELILYLTSDKARLAKECDWWELCYR